MRRFLWPTTLLLLALLMLSGCGGKWFGAKKEAEPEPPEVVGLLPAPEPVVVAAPVQAMLPDRDWQIRFQIADFGKEPVPVLEELIRVENRLVATQAGNPYVTWVLNEEGLWRQDPRGGGALLRYLPPVLADPEAWKQSSGEQDVWFRLTPGAPFCDNLAVAQRQLLAEECWTLTVVNRKEELTLIFAPGLGAVWAESKNHLNQSDSFVKRMDRDRPGGLSPEHREEALKKAPVPRGAPAPVVPVTLEQFAEAARLAASQ